MRAGGRGRQEDGNEEQRGEREEGGREGVKEGRRLQAQRHNCF